MDKSILLLEWYSGNFRSPESFFIYGGFLMKKYKTNEELLAHLESKNVVIKNREEALNKIKKYTYYSIINSYKLNFKDEYGNYKDKVSFEEIYALYNFDKNIKYLFLKYSLELEIQIKSLMANQIAKVYGIENYLDKNNLDESASDELKEKLIERINKDIDEEYKIHLAIIHYKDKYGYVPPFVLTKVLTFGVASSYYGLLKQSDRQAISKYFKVTDKFLKQALKNLTMVRNISAHNDRLFCFRSKSYLSYKEIDKNYKRKDNETNLYMIIKTMEYLLKDDLKDFITIFNKEVDQLKQELTSIDIKDILTIMGFPSNN
mgnify:CR=1 FL=1